MCHSCGSGCLAEIRRVYFCSFGSKWQLDIASVPVCLVFRFTACVASFINRSKLKVWVITKARSAVEISVTRELQLDVRCHHNCYSRQDGYFRCNRHDVTCDFGYPVWAISPVHVHRNFSFPRWRLPRGNTTASRRTQMLLTSQTKLGGAN